MSEEKAPAIRLSTWNWVSLIVIIASASVANIGGIHSMATHNREEFRTEMLAMDQKWQDRTDILATQIRTDLKEIKNSIPPDWFRQMVESNATHIEKNAEQIDKLEDEFTRDFVRKDELEAYMLRALRDRGSE